MYLPNFKKDKRKLLTKNLVPGISHFSEKLITINGAEYREWEPKRSKLGAAIVKQIKETGLKEDSVILYLGASHGYTPSFISDMCSKGFIYALDFAPRVVRDLVYVCEKRSNICPILASANIPQQYFFKVPAVDIVYQDIAQKNQSEIFLKNVRMFLKKNGYGMLAVKARSVDVSAKPSKVFKEVRKELEKELIIIDQKTLDPIERDHCFFVCKKK